MAAVHLLCVREIANGTNNAAKGAHFSAF
jgi:hypothetical protein